MIDHKKFPEPYRILFPLGVIGGISGVILWLLFPYGLLSFYPRDAHFVLMTFVFLWSFVAGFLMTAIPRMTRTKAAGPGEILLASAAVIAQGVMSIKGSLDWVIVLHGAQVALLLVFLFSRFLVFRKIPFSGFVFLPFGFIFAALSVGLSFSAEGTDRFDFLAFGSEALLVNLIFGLGGRLIPVLSRLPGALMPDQQSFREQWAWPLVVCLLLNSGYAASLSGVSEAGSGLRLLAHLAAMFSIFGFFLRPSLWSVLGLSLKVSVLCLTLGEGLRFLGLLTPQYDFGVAGGHVSFIGGICLVTLLVSTRVVLSHGGASLEEEIRSRRIALMTILILLAMIFRLFAGEMVMGVSLQVASGTLILAFLIWLYRFVQIEKWGGVKGGH